MHAVERRKLREVLHRHRHGDGHERLFSALVGSNQKARDAFNARYRAKPIPEWTAVEKENTLGYMLGFNIIHG